MTNHELVYGHVFKERKNADLFGSACAECSHLTTREPMEVLDVQMAILKKLEDIKQLL